MSEEDEYEELPDEYHEHIGVPWKPNKRKTSKESS
jgi:hypothetical protein